jgi:hypothetical protein
MRLFLVLIISAMASGACAQEVIARKLDSIAKTLGMEFVYGERFPLSNPLGSYGAPAVFNIENSGDSWTCLFLCRKRSQSIQSEDPFYGYDYYLVFTRKLGDGPSQTTVLQTTVGLKGMSLYYGPMSLQLSKFNYMDGNREKGPAGVRASSESGSIPVVISSESATVFLYYYKGRWLEFVEVLD